jgi:5,10-methylenetetrahydromethanopterin reductase
LARAYLDEVRRQVNAGAARADRSPERCEVALMLEVAIDDDVARARDALRGRCLLMVGGEYAENLIPLYGLDPARVAPVRAAVRGRDSRAASLIDDAMVDAFAAGGPAGHVAARLAEIATAGVGALIVSPGAGADAPAILRLGRALREAFP